MPKACTILGMGASSSGNIETLGEVWSMNDAYQCFSKDGKTPQFNLFFEIHDLLYARNFRSKACPQNDHFTRLDMLNCNVMMRDIIPDVRLSLRYPIERVMNCVGTDFLRGTPAFMLAYAVFMNYTHVRVFGIDQMDDGHKYQRESWAHIVGIAVGRGIEMSGVFKFMEAPEQDNGLIGWLDGIKQKKEIKNG